MLDQNKNYDVNIYYTEEEAKNSISQDLATHTDYSKIHIFTKDPSPLTRLISQDNVELHSVGTVWDRLKAWVNGEEQFQEEFSALNITAEDREHYRNIILNGGTVVLISNDAAIDSMFATPENQYYANAEGEMDVSTDPDLLSSSEVEEMHRTDPEHTAKLFANDSYIEDDAESTFTKAEQAFFEDKPQLEEALNEKTEKMTYNRIPNEAEEHPGDTYAHLDAYEDSKAEMPNSEHQLQDLEEDKELYSQQLEEEEYIDEDSPKHPLNHVHDDAMGDATEYRRHDLP